MTLPFAEDVEQKEFSHIVGGISKWYSDWKDSLAFF